MARFTRVCTYDRAGSTWSDVGPEFDSFNQASKDLHVLLTKAGVPPPYVLVGHSFGGLLVRHYQAAYPAEVAAIVLVDSSHEESLQPVGGKVVRIPDLTAAQYQKLIDTARAKRPQNQEPELAPHTVFPPYDQLPAQIQILHLWALGKDAARKNLGPQAPARSCSSASNGDREPTSTRQYAACRTYGVRIYGDGGARHDFRRWKTRSPSIAE